MLTSRELELIFNIFLREKHRLTEFYTRVIVTKDETRFLKTAYSKRTGVVIKTPKKPGVIVLDFTLLRELKNNNTSPSLDSAIEKILARNEETENISGGAEIRFVIEELYKLLE
ncbi:MAG: hypothetical protein EOP48_14355 [Sphingobacteriales bacterium]|nr:MAG: hypothetical protein EOP48_14355 [Sphingobacteriales bacterium]